MGTPPSTSAIRSNRLALSAWRAKSRALAVVGASATSAGAAATARAPAQKRSRVRERFDTRAVSAWDVLLGVWQNGGQVIVLAGGGYALATARSVPGQIDANDRSVAALDRDLRRWLHDRDQQLTATTKLIEAYARNPDLEGPLVDELVALRAPVPDELRGLPAGSEYHSGAHLRWQANARAGALHEYRDRATETLDLLDEVRASEGRWHGILRKRRGVPPPTLVLAPAERDVLARWRADVDLGDGMTMAIRDVSRADGEARLRELEPSLESQPPTRAAEAPP